MGDLRDWLLERGESLEVRLDRVRRRVKRRIGATDPVTIQPYRGYGDAGHIRLKGRVLEVTGTDKPEPDDSTWDNLRRMLRRYESDELPDARIEARVDGRTVELVTDLDGFFELDLDVSLDPDPGPEQRWRSVDLELLEPLRDGQDPVRVTGHVLTPPRSARFGVISDVDDTIIETSANRMLASWRIILSHNAHTRTAFPGLAAFYRALERGPDDRPVNPIFYVSSSPWNLFDLFERFLELHDIPLGPMFFKDFGLDQHKLLKGGHSGHKLGAIEHLLSRYPDLPFILIGDSGQKDAEIYRRVVELHPHRILAVYIRDVTGDERDREAQKLLEQVREAGVQAAFGTDLLEAADNAAEHGIITADAVREVRAEVESADR